MKHIEHVDLHTSDKELFELILSFYEQFNLLKDLLDSENICIHTKMLSGLQRINIFSDLANCIIKMQNFLEHIVGNHDCSKEERESINFMKNYIKENDKSVN